MMIASQGFKYENAIIATIQINIVILILSIVGFNLCK